MTDKEILIKALEITIKNGYNCAWWLCEFNVSDSKGDGLYFSECANLEVALEKLDWHIKTFPSRPAKLYINPKMDSYYQIILTHEFAKAFWGEEEIFDIETDEGDKLIYKEYDHEISYHLSSWKFHIQKMVLEKEPLKYLEKFL